jgi:hypothetical protein
MVGLVLTAEQIRSAPSEVRQWLKAVLEAELGWDLVEHGPEAARFRLAACSLEEAAGILERIRNDYVTAQVFFELGREGAPAGAHFGDLCRLTFLDMARHTRVGNFQQLAACLETIAAAFRDVKGDPGAILFAFDQRGGLYLHQATHQSIARLWQQLVAPEGSPSASAGPGSSMPMPPLAASPAAE